ncbi:carbohydrate-binding protein [Rhodoferax koreense]|uniref:Carbohydrate-binding protein n=1 Tax=Rhodoferax koreensis TaxID=1842727 RepID=A0A1P8K4M9_9BURK|nr:carbohydrate-binding protein [Rhodoferax koreense]
MLNGALGAVQPPIRSEIFGLQRFAQHGRSLGLTHQAATTSARAATFVPRLKDNIRALRQAHAYIGEQASTGYDISPAAEWLLDNFHLIEAQLKEIQEGLPRSYFRALPVLIDEPLAGLPRIYGVAWAFVAHTDGAFNEELLVQFLNAYQETRKLQLNELWALPTTLRVVLVENLRRLAERVATHKAAREVANLCWDHIERYSLDELDQLLALMNLRGVGRVFLAQLGQRQQDLGRDPENLRMAVRDWLQRALPDLAAAQAQHAADQAADNLSVSNALTSLRAIGDADWPDLIGSTSGLMRAMLTSPLFAAEHAGTRDQTLHGIELLARRHGRDEVEVAQKLLALMRSGPGDTARPASGDPATTSASYWLRGDGRARLMQSLGLREPMAAAWRAVARRLTLPVYLGALVCFTLGLVAWMVLHHLNAPGASPAGGWPLWLLAFLMLFPASEAVVALVNRLISESARPRHLPRLALADGIAPEHRVMVVIPAMLTDEASIAALMHRLQLHYLANAERNAQFALLTDWADADTATRPTDEPLLACATAHIRALDARYAGNAMEDVPRFILLHRPRSFSETEQRWIGWERKRGKLEQLIAALATGDTSAFLDLGDASRIAPGTPYIVTLDSDTQLPPARLRELVGVAAHPQNWPRVDTRLRRVVSGYGILQPRVVTPLPAPRDFTPYHWLFAGQCGIDPYSAASSEVYQDLFGEGSFSGKGLLHVQAMYAVLDRRLPEGRVLSHDLLEGSLARCAAVTDITIIEDAPFHADVAASRVHRWTRGDWQLLPFLLDFKAYPMRAIHRWKLFDNLRRSLVAPMSLLLLLVVLGGGGLAPWSALALVAAAFLAGPLMGAVAGFSPSRDDLAREHFYRQAATDLGRTLAGGLWQLAQLLQNALLTADAIGRALYRMLVSRRHLLQWTTAAAAQAAAQTRLPALARRHWAEPVAAVLVFGAIWLTPQTMPSPLLAALLCAVWAAAPVWTWWVSRPNPWRQVDALPAEDQAYLEGIARDTWRLFERCVGPAENHLPPDNLQTSPYDMVAHRTSPTNIGLYLLAAACARQFGWIGTQDLLTRLEATLATLHRLPRHRGHFLNWYDTERCEALMPMYVSTVDSGNLSGHLLAVAQACRELAHAPFDTAAAIRGLAMSKQRMAGLLAVSPPLLPALRARAAWATLLALPAEEVPAELSFGALLDEAGAELAARQKPPAEPTAVAEAATQEDVLAWRLADHLATLRSAWQDRRANIAEMRRETESRLRSVAHDCEKLAWQADFAFLYHPKRHLLHIGYRVAEQQRDAGFYDLLASESRLTSLLAIAKGDVPVAHWASLGRPFYAVGAVAGLRSWSGSMFEYLMPTLVLDEPHGSVLREACRAALREQIAFGVEQQVPWGISESAYAGSDHTLAYQYAPQGVPRLALRRTPPGELVIAPYATALAAQIAPHRSAQNYARIESMTPRARYGFIEALDFSRARQTGGGPFTPVDTFMAHHQGMSIVALANVLLGGPAQRWGMANPSIEAVASLLHERAPREVSKLYAPSTTPPALALLNRAPGLLREVTPGAAAVEPTHVLSNGRYNVSLRPNGAGWSRWGQTGITRWRDDALRDAFGSFFYLRRPGDVTAPVSITQHPAPDAAAQYRSTYHADRVCFDAAWPLLQAHTTVWVSPEDDIEFRRVELRNLGDTPLDIELISAFEVTLSDPRADEAHPAFTNLFVRAEWLASQQALLFERKPRLPTEHALRAAHFLTDADPQIVGLRVQTDRNRWQGRNQASGQPRAELDDAPGLPTAGDTAAGVVLDTGLDPVSVLAVRLRIAPQGKARLTFATAASDDAATLRAVIDKYSQHSHVQRASLMSATLTGIRLRSLGIGSDNFAAAQSLTTALLLSLTRPRFGPPGTSGAPGPNEPAFEGCDRRLLWRFGISGDRPIILVSAGVAEGLGLLRSLAQALRMWSWSGTACDLVVLNAEPASYLMALHREIAALRERTLAEISGEPGSAQIGFYLLRTEELSRDEIGTLQCLARVRLNADGRPLLHHVDEWRQQHAAADAERATREARTIAFAPRTAQAATPSHGDFTPGSGEFRFQVARDERPQRPWINVLSNRGFGAQISEAGGGYTWAVNSRLNQLTAWSNDPVADSPSEWFLLQDRKTREIWNVAPSAWGTPGAEAGGEPVRYRVTHGQGYTSIGHRRGDVEVSASWCVDAESSVKQVRIRLVNRGHRTQQLRLVGIAEWIMGANRSDRGSTHTAAHRADAGERPLTALLCTQRDRSAGFGDGTAFLALAAADEATDAADRDWTCDRREVFDTFGRLQLPDRFGQQAGTGLDPCAALSTTVTIATGETVERVFLLGYGDNPAAARALAQRAAATSAATRLETVRSQWNTLLGATTVKTPDPLFDALVNRWLLYQTVTCRLWAKAGFYQAGGATGFRDQLQDAMALAWAEPATLRAQIVLCASRQFPEGDVQHWWHAPTGAGVRTHFSDDLLWLAHATHHYLQATGDASLLDEEVAFLEGAGIPEHAEDAYYTPSVNMQRASVFEHAARAIDRSLAVGVHGLPLMGSGDWNDGMNRVGIEGKGESVWLGWFLCKLVDDFAPVAAARGEHERAQRWQHAAAGWKAALQGTAWDGAWFKRAFFDDGTPLGSHSNAEARIDLIAQAWAVLSNAATPEQQHTAMAAVESHLVDHEAGLVRLLDPPLDKAVPSAGYIQAYPPGVRENGGQYSHGAVWALMAQAELAQQTPQTPERATDNADAAYRTFTHLSPAHRARHPTFGAAYAIEPYVMAGDVYTQPPYVGRGGWSWYTGSAAWMHRAAIEAIFGLKQTAEELHFEPCLPSHWPQAELTLRRGERSMRFILVRAAPETALAAAGRMSPDVAVRVLKAGEMLRWRELAGQSCFVVPLA